MARTLLGLFEVALTDPLEVGQLVTGTRNPGHVSGALDLGAVRLEVTAAAGQFIPGQVIDADYSQLLWRGTKIWPLQNTTIPFCCV
jgi:hypothetical protein